jgi:hypothetical protein
VNSAIAKQRLHNQCITRAAGRHPADVVAWLGAVQAQEYPAARWAVGLRLPEGITDAAIERAFDEGRILRTHVMRPTWHFVTPSDIRWMLELTAPRVHRAIAYHQRYVELDSPTLNRGTTLIERAVGDGEYLTRAELGLHLERARLIASGQRLAHLVLHAELEGVICSGPRRGKQFTYALLEKRARSARRLTRDEALAELTLRYFRSHAPATVRDFVWWSGLTTDDAKRGLEINRAQHETVDGRLYWSIGGGARKNALRRNDVHLLPIYDEYLVAYRDRDAVPHVRSTISAPAWRNVNFLHALVISGQIAGTWRTARSARGVHVDVIPLRRLTRIDRRAVNDAVARYERFLGVPVSLSVA